MSYLTVRSLFDSINIGVIPSSMLNSLCSFPPQAKQVSGSRIEPGTANCGVKFDKTVLLITVLTPQKAE
jgi:hypothetical protein